jgi:hypothetical protein
MWWEGAFDLQMVHSHMADSAEMRLGPRLQWQRGRRSGVEMEEGQPIPRPGPTCRVRGHRPEGVFQCSLDENLEEEMLLWLKMFGRRFQPENRRFVQRVEKISPVVAFQDRVNGRKRQRPCEHVEQFAKVGRVVPGFEKPTARFGGRKAT